MWVRGGDGGEDLGAGEDLGDDGHGEEASTASFVALQPLKFFFFFFYKFVWGALRFKKRFVV